MDKLYQAVKRLYKDVAGNKDTAETFLDVIEKEDKKITFEDVCWYVIGQISSNVQYDLDIDFINQEEIVEELISKYKKDK